MNLEVVLLFLEDRCLNEVITFLNFSLMNYSIENIMTLIVPQISKSLTIYLR